MITSGLLACCAVVAIGCRCKFRSDRIRRLERRNRMLMMSLESTLRWSHRNQQTVAPDLN
jgi:hypothetical protein